MSFNRLTRMLVAGACVLALAACSGAPRYAEYNSYIPGAGGGYHSDGSDYFGGAGNSVRSAGAPNAAQHSISNDNYY